MGVRKVPRDWADVTRWVGLSRVHSDSREIVLCSAVGVQGEVD